MVRFLRELLQGYQRASAARPLGVAFITCGVKGAASDAVAQKVVERKEEFNFHRNCSFAFFSAAYLGVGQHMVYNVAFTRIFGAGTELRVAVPKVIADATVHVPLLYLPLYYMFADTALGIGSPESGLQRYQTEFWATCGAYWKVFPVFHLVNFTMTPPELRIGFVACVSFVWLIILSVMSHRNMELGTPGASIGSSFGADGQSTSKVEHSADTASAPQDLLNR
eukprot:CAMPEP_0115083744 /NCGR_PEP_ID=MMETSP0227-20121206/20776_1 /TAXON_ID=89957 /ORGANISM="Polarella glacialis, Strain CCMP 1383" /LENGTH=223 /DNA_ID=CAMNT_0002472277 /DNA_START=42 /DNA_END=713 /DNA_ORIENTATION=+